MLPDANPVYRVRILNLPADPEAYRIELEKALNQMYDDGFDFISISDIPGHLQGYGRLYTRLVMKRRRIS